MGIQGSSIIALFMKTVTIEWKFLKYYQSGKPMKPMIFLNKAQMERDEGLLENDREIHCGGSYVEEYGYWHEIFNFNKIGNKVYGYAQP